MELMWLVAVALGPLVLGGILAYAVLSRRRLTRREQDKRDRATEKLYRGEQER